MATKTKKQQPQLTRIYLRASTDKQNASRAKDQLTEFATEKGLIIAGYYEENESGTVLERPELNRLIADSKPNDIILFEDIDRLSRLTFNDWQELKQRINAKQLNMVALFLEPTHSVITLSADENTRWFASILNNLVIDLSAHYARKDYENRRIRTRQGIDKVLNDPVAKAEKYLGRPADLEKYSDIMDLLEKGVSWRKVSKTMKASITTIKKAKDWHEQGRPDLNIKFKERKRKSKSRLTAIDDSPAILPPSEPIAEPKAEPAPIPSPKPKAPAKRTKKANAHAVEPVKCDKTPDMFPDHDHDWRLQGLTDEQIEKIKDNVWEFGDFNIELNNDIQNFMQRFIEHWQHDLKDPAKLHKFKGIDEILAK